MMNIPEQGGAGEISPEKTEKASYNAKSRVGERKKNPQEDKNAPKNLKSHKIYEIYK